MDDDRTPRVLGCGECLAEFSDVAAFMDHLMETGHAGFNAVAADQPGLTQRITQLMEQMRTVEDPTTLEGMERVDAEDEPEGPAGRRVGDDPGAISLHLPDRVEQILRLAGSRDQGLPVALARVFGVPAWVAVGLYDVMSPEEYRKFAANMRRLADNVLAIVEAEDPRAAFKLARAQDSPATGKPS